VKKGSKPVGYQAARRAEIEGLDERYAALKKQGINPFDRLGIATEDDMDKPVPYQRHDVKIGRNEPCPCGSGKKYKRCCGR